MDVKIFLEQDGAGVRKQLRGFGAVIEFIRKNGEPVTREAYGLDEATENQIMLSALAEAIEVLTKECDITVYLNNEYVAANLSNGKVEDWIVQGWKTKKGEPIANREEWERLHAVEGMHRISFIQVKEHHYSRYLQNEIKKMKNERIRWEQQTMSNL